MTLTFLYDQHPTGDRLVRLSAEFIQLMELWAADRGCTIHWQALTDNAASRSV